MTTFAKYFKSALTEAKFREIPEQITQQANKIADEYFEQTKSLTPAVIKQVKKIGLSADWQEYFEEEKGEVWFLAELTTVEFIDLKTNKPVKFDVYIALGKNNENYAICDDDNKVIIIYEFNTRNLDREKFVSIMVHEITHGFQQYKTYSNKYEKMKANKKVSKTDLDVQYYKEPVEVDAFMTEIAYTIRREFQKLKNDIASSKLPETKKIMERKLEKFLAELRIFINSPLDTYFAHKELPLPYSFERFEELLTFIQKTPKLWRSFKLRLEDLYKKLTGEDIRGRSEEVEKPAN